MSHESNLQTSMEALTTSRKAYPKLEALFSLHRSGCPVPTTRRESENAYLARSAIEQGSGHPGISWKALYISPNTYHRTI